MLVERRRRMTMRRVGVSYLSSDDAAAAAAAVVDDDSHGRRLHSSS